MSSIVPSDRQLLLASRAALAAGSRLQSGDPELTALFDAADTALGVLIGRTAISAQPSGPLSAELINLVAREAEEARSCLVSADVPKVGDVTGSDALRAEIQAHLPGSRISSYKRLAGGFSRETIALTLECDGEPQNLILRRQQEAGLLEGIGLSVAEEFPLLEMLHAAGIAVPAPLWLEAESQVLGGAYSVSQRVAGVGRGTSISETGITPAMIKAMAILLAQVHSVAWQKQASSLLPAFGLTAVPATRTTATRDYLARWDGYSAFHAITLSPALSQTRQWLWDNIPADDKVPSLLHGDVGFHNILFDEDRITALLDWELTFLGHPAKDLAQLHNMVVAHLPWDRFMGWYRSAGGEAVAQRAILYFQIFSGFNYLLVCEVARQVMLEKPQPNIAYASLAFTARAYFYGELRNALEQGMRPASKESGR